MKARLRIFAIFLVASVALTAAAITARNRFADPPISLRVDRSERVMYVYENGTPTLTFPIAVGTAKHPTPTGRFTMSEVIWNPRWVPPSSEWARNQTPKSPGDPANPMQAVKIYFKPPAYYIHGTNVPGSIGEAASHGCIRMDPADAITLARLLMEATGVGRDDNWYADVTGNPTRSVTIALGEAVPIVIVP